MPFNKVAWKCIDPVSVVFSSNAVELALTRMLALFIGSRDSPLYLFHLCIYTHPFFIGSVLTCNRRFLLFVTMQINAQDIYYQEQLGHGNGGAVYK